MAKIIKQSEIVECSSRELEFYDESGSIRYGFACDENGNVQVNQLTEAAQRSYQRALEHEKNDGWTSELQVRHWHYREPGVLRCDCGRNVELEGFTCPCDCGRDYNASGQLLAPREQWGEETGEHWTDCFSTAVNSRKGASK